ncbi:hypothetical protein AC249_AIPGENE2758 [Exaiptasia diaphana]|nr:hypothetical protein AC249_AIPGENE2758 [Exaiptasia diaphana]
MMKAVKAAIAQQRLTSELQLKQPEQRQDAITLPLLLDYEFDLPECQEQIHTDYLVTFARSDKYFKLPRVKSPEIRLPSPGSSPEQKVSTEEEKSPHQADRKDITLPDIDFDTILEEEIKLGLHSRELQGYGS